MLNEMMVNVKYSTGSDNEAEKAAMEMLNILGDETLTINLQQHEISWCSSAFLERFNEISPGTSLKLLYQIFDGMEYPVSRFFQNASSENAREKAVVKYDKKTGFDIELVPFYTQQLLIRFKDISAYRSEIQRYLQDREQLFSTSRTISVSEMATTLAHEINQPIGTIKNLLQGIRSRLIPADIDDKSVIAATERAIEQTQFAARIISRIRDYTQARIPEKVMLDLVALVKDCVSLLDWEIDHQNIDCQLRLPSEPFMISGDELMLQQVFVNLLRNAIDAMRDQSDAKKILLVSSHNENNQITIQIEDTGCGLSEEAEKKLFQPFVSAKPTGMGIGLNICRSFMELHQGRLWLTTNNHVGCTSHVQLPMPVKEE